MTKVTAYMATFPGREKTLAGAAKSIAKQVDHLYIWVNNWPVKHRFHLIEVADTPNVTLLFSDKELAKGEKGNIGDIGKFWMMDEWEGYIFTVDDTWIYPNNYVERMIATVEKYDRKAIVSVHARVIDKPMKSYYYFTETALFLYNEVKQDAPCNEFGTGVMALHSDILKGGWFDLKTFERTNMTDIYLSIAANKAGIPAVCISHAAYWVKPHPKAFGIKRISATCSKNEKIQVDTCNAHNWKLIPLP